MAGYGDAETKKLRENVENQLGRLLQQLQVGSARAAARHVLSCVHAYSFILAPRGLDACTHTYSRTQTAQPYHSMWSRSQQQSYTCVCARM
jgi:hypothetical protein